MSALMWDIKIIRHPQSQGGEGSRNSNTDSLGQITVKGKTLSLKGCFFMKMSESLDKCLAVSVTSGLRLELLCPM